MNKKHYSESAKRIITLLLGLIQLVLETGIYAWFWFKSYYPELSGPRISQDGYNLGYGLKFQTNGHIVVLLIYFMLLFFFARTYGSLRVGYNKPLDVFLSQIFTILIVNVITYMQLSLMRNWLVSAGPMMKILFWELVFAFCWTYLSDIFYRSFVQSPRPLLLISGDHPTDDIERKFGSRADRFKIVKRMNISSSVEELKKECLSSEYGGVIIWDIPTARRNDLVKFCYENRIRMYIMPKISDVLLKGADQLHLFDTPVLLVREYSLKVEQRFLKRLIDVVCSLILIVLFSPLMLITAISVFLCDRGPVLYKQVRCTEGRREFEILKFRSMYINAEKDGVARLASKNDSRITPVGRVIRRIRFDELPQLFNILKGDMSFIGPRPERPEIIKGYMEEMPEFAYRMNVKAGLAGYAQVYGKYNTTPYDKLKLDLTYIENYSVWMDIKLMLLTLKILFTPDATEGVDEDQITAMKKEARDNEQ
ncbi:sugar transferase [Butyrivibrio sp. MC2013]|uniref:sugar transferase n=1 Tax=Butyrivibrio sp. MC2013 TaxID=1280686 RepID=UPI00041FB128|nr:sugar transferase [Butyrivibrio sp. MC2013]